MNASFTHFTSMIHENSVLTSRFGTFSLQHEEKTTEQIPLSWNTFKYNYIFS